MAALSRSLRHRITRRGRSPYVWGVTPVLSPFEERLRRAALGDQVCQLFQVPL